MDNGNRDVSSLQDAVGEIEKLPTLPTILAEIMGAASDPDASALELGKKIWPGTWFGICPATWSAKYDFS